MNQNLIYFNRVFAPRDEVPFDRQAGFLFRQKDPKSFLPVPGPAGPFPALPNQDGLENRGVYPESFVEGLKQSSLNS